MKIFSINDVLKWCQVFSNGRKHTCYTKMVDNNLYFKFKGKWHVVSEYVTELTSVYIKRDVKYISIPYDKFINK